MGRKETDVANKSNEGPDGIGTTRKPRKERPGGKFGEGMRERERERERELDASDGDEDDGASQTKMTAPQGDAGRCAVGRAGWSQRKTTPENPLHTCHPPDKSHTSSDKPG
eukprot:TRINITY_DN4856_c0_g1_i1.p1 TRINITY_DN4856_c0_g1~~TRINITY_DN4856_c0_g1_i1.p1  ORF type:complete len:111 (-),score=6.44 TRINITY_DN4856_c0_g1_i1:105-437(-)